MSFQSRRELTAKVAPRYREATKKQKTAILDEFLATTGYKRKYATRLLSLPEIPPAKKIQRPRARYYSKEVQDALLVAWSAANYIASKRLAPFLKDLVPLLERHGHLELRDGVRSQLQNPNSFPKNPFQLPRAGQDGVGSHKTSSLSTIPLYEHPYAISPVGFSPSSRFHSLKCFISLNMKKK